ncbi:hypothetical protein AAEX63_14045 [Luteococcus sp. H138]|uniref:hypothetical protein n=1 Tax=unclassified Luteococcus TaxID=2639923 RepID=UPI00313B5536
MPIQIVALYVEPAVQAGLDSGALVQYGGVVRDAGGAIAQHLPTVAELAVKKAKDIAPQAKALAAHAKNPVVIAGAATVLAVGAAAAGTATLVDRRKHALKRRLNKALTAYITAGQDQSLTTEHIDRTIETLDALTTDKPTIALDDLGLEALAANIDDFTQRLANANPTALAQPIGNPATLAGMRANLAYQRALLHTPKELPPA